MYFNESCSVVWSQCAGVYASETNINVCLFYKEKFLK